MKKVKFFVFIFLLPIFLLGCVKREEVANVSVEETTEEIDFEVDSIKLTKSFQNTEPYGQILKPVKSKKKNGKRRILVSLGLMESSGAKVEKVLKTNNQLDIYVSSIFDQNDLQLAVPQLTLEIEEKYIDKPEDTSINIINTNSKPIKVKVGINDILSKIQTHFKVSTNSNPKVNLVKNEDNLVWQVEYNSIFDKDNKDFPLIDLFTSFNAENGEILESHKNFISNSIDNGHVIHYVDDYLIYKKALEAGEELWAYNVNSSDKTLLFTTNYKILNIEINPNHKSMAIIEETDIGKNLYLVNQSDLKAYKILLDEVIPSSVIWKDPDTMLVVSKDKKETSIYQYDISKSVKSKFAHLNKDLQCVQFKNDQYLVVENKSDESLIYLTSDFSEFKLLDKGISPKFLGDGAVVFLKPNKDNNDNQLYIRSLTEEKSDLIDKNIVTFKVINNDLFMVKNSSNHNSYTLIQYDKTKEDKVLANSITGNINYNPEKNEIYIGVSLPADLDLNKEHIYSINLEKEQP